MTSPTPNLEIHLHNVDGSLEKYIQSETDRIQQVLNDFQPAQIFCREHIIIAVENSLTIYATRQVVRIDLVSESSVHWVLPPGIVEAVELTEAEFRALHQDPEMIDRWKQAQAQDTSLVAFLQLETAGQPPLFLAMEIQLPPPDGLETVLPLLAAPALCFRMRNGGVAALNLAHLVRFTFFPALQPPPPNAWPANRVNETVSQPEAGIFHGAPAGRASLCHSRSGD